MHINILDPHDEKEWDKYFLKNKYTCFLQSFCWAELVKIAYGYKPVFLEVQDDGNPVAYFMFHEQFLYIRSDKIGHKLINRFGKFFTQYIETIGGPVVLDDTKTEAIIANILEWLDEYSRRNHIPRINLTPFRLNESYADNPHIKAIFEGFGYTTKTWATYLVDLTQDEESLWQSIRRTARKKIKKAMKVNVMVKKIKNYSEYIEKYILPYNEMEKDFGRSEIPLSFVEKTKNFDLMRKYYHYFYAEIEGKIVAVWSMYIYNGYATGMMSSISKYAYENKIPAQDLLHWAIFLEAKKLGCHTFDMAGVNPNPVDTKEKGIRDYKEKWGGLYVEYNQFEKRESTITAYLEKLGRRGYSIVQTLRQRSVLGRDK